MLARIPLSENGDFGDNPSCSATKRRTICSRPLMIKQLLHRVLPVAVSAGLIAGLLYLIPPSKVATEFVKVPWEQILPVTAAMVLALYFWDAVCLQTVFATDSHVVPYRRMLHVRGTSYLLGAFNYELGQGLVAWSISRLQKISLLQTISRSVVLAYHDLAVLLSVGLVGSLLVENPPLKVRFVELFARVGLAGLVTVALVFFLLPREKRERFQQTRWGAWLVDWNWRRSLRLAWQRLVYFGILILYAGVALAICGVPVDSLVVASAIPVVLLADALPSVCGIGTRETALILLLNPENRAAIFALSLIWSTGIIVGRMTIGLLHYWVPERAAE